jgi:hypothetical protein
VAAHGPAREPVDEQAGEVGTDERLEARVRAGAAGIESGEGSAVLEQQLCTTPLRLRRSSNEHGDFSIAARTPPEDP